MSNDRNYLNLDNNYKELLKRLGDRNLYRGFLIGNFIKHISNAIFNDVREDHEYAIFYLREMLNDSFINLKGDNSSFDAYVAKCRDLYLSSDSGESEVSLDMKFFDYLHLSLPSNSVALASLSNLISTIITTPNNMNEFFFFMKKLFYYETFLTYFNIMSIKEENSNDAGTIANIADTKLDEGFINNEISLINK